MDIILSHAVSRHESERDIEADVAKTADCVDGTRGPLRALASKL